MKWEKEYQGMYTTIYKGHRVACCEHYQHRHGIEVIAIVRKDGPFVIHRKIIWDDVVGRPSWKQAKDKTEEWLKTLNL